MADKIRCPICAVLGHVDHGKSSLLDKIRGTAIINTEAGGITQAIGASIVPINTIKKICGNLLLSIKNKINIPGLLFIDTPGHEAFTSLRKRGGNLADIAILVIDINEGFKPQTLESLEILFSFKTPFIIAANKIDLIPGWRSDNSIPLLQNINNQSQDTITKIETKLYEVVGKLNEFNPNLNAERFDRVEDYTKQIAIVPVSAYTGEGLPELLMVLTGLTQKYLEQNLHFKCESNAKGTILEVKEEKGLGLSMDVIIYDGTLCVNDTIVIGTLSHPIVSKVRSLLEPLPLSEMRDKKTKFKSVKKVVAAMGVKIVAPNIEGVVAGMPLIAAKDNIEEVKQKILNDTEEIFIETDTCGVFIKADTIGSLEAVIHILKTHNIPIRKALIGNITKKDIIEAEAQLDDNPLCSVILAFNVKEETDYISKIKIFKSDTIYKLIEDYLEWKEKEEKKLEEQKLTSITSPCLIKIIPHYIFRQSNPAIVGIEVLSGQINVGKRLMNHAGILITQIEKIQNNNKSVDKAIAGDKVAVSLSGVTINRQISKDEELLSYLTEQEFKKLKEIKDSLSQKEIEVLKKIAFIMRKNNPLWGR